MIEYWQENLVNKNTQKDIDKVINQIVNIHIISF